MKSELNEKQRAVATLCDGDEDIKELRKLKREELFRYENRAFEYYTPNGKVEEYIRAVGCGQNFIILFSAANSVGKTAASTNIVAHILWGGQSKNKYFDFPLFKQWPFPKRGRIASDPENIKTNLVPSLREWFPLGHYRAEKQGKAYESLWHTDTGWDFDVMSYEQEAKEYESTTLGWCIAEGERVLVENGGWKAIENLKVGDLVWTANPQKKLHKITAKTYKGFRDTLKVKTRSGYEITATPEHKIWANGKWIEISKLKKGDRLYSPEFSKYLLKNNTIEPNIAFMTGVWLGDGWANKSLFVACASKELLAEIKYRVDRIIHKQRYDYRIVDKKLRDFIIKQDLIEKKAGTKFIPTVFFSENIAARELIKGLYATDGWFSKHQIGYGTTSQKLANDLRLLLGNWGIRASVCFKKRQKPQWNDQWFVLITQKDNIIKFCYEFPSVPGKESAQAKVYQEAKRRKGLTIGRERQKRDTRKTVVSVEKVGKHKVYDISVEGEHSFICNGLKVSNCWFDEPPPEPIFKATVARMRKGGIIFISETPLYAAWLYDHIIANPDKDLAEKGQRVYVEADIEAACKQHGIRGHLEHSHIEKIIGEYSEEEKQARIYGKFQHLVGLRFKQFSRNIHIVRPFDIHPAKFSVYEALDTHPRVNDMANWIAVDSQGRKFVVDELWVKCQGGTDELARKIKGIAAQYRIERRIIEPGAFVEDQHTGQSLQAALSGRGLNYLEASKLRTAADRRIEDALTYNKISLPDREEFIKAPELYIFDNCQRTIWEFEHYRWDDWTGKIAEKKGQKEKTVDKDDHAIENIGRILIQEPVFVPIPKENEGGTIPDYDPY